MNTRKHTRPEHAIVITIAVLFASALLSGFTSAPASAAVKTWRGVGTAGGTTSADFNLASNWSPATALAATDSCVVALTSIPTSTITLSANATIAALKMSLAATGATSNPTFSTGGTSTLTITPNGTAGSLNVDALTSGGAQFWLNVGAASSGSNGAIVVNGPAYFGTNSSQLVFVAGRVAAGNGRLEFRGDVTWGTQTATSATSVPFKYIFDGAGTQTFTNNMTGTLNMGNVDIGSATASPTVVWAGTGTIALSGTSVNADLTIYPNATLDLGTRTLNRTATGGGTVSVGAGSTLRLGATTGGQTGSNFPLNYTTVTLNPTSTVDYDGAAQTIYSTPTYGNLTLTSSGGSVTKTAGGALTVAGDLIINPNATFAASTFTHIVRGNWSNSGVFTASTGTINLNGSAAQTIGGSAATTFNNLIVNNSAGVTLNQNATVGTTLTFTAGKVTTGANTLTLSTTNATGAAQGTGWVIGNLKRNFTSGAASRTYEVGDASFYTPMTIAMTGLGAATDITGSVGTPDHPNLATSAINPAKSVNRYWTLTPTGTPTFTSYSATFSFVAANYDAGANTSNFVVSRYAGSAWTLPTVGTRTATSTQATGITGGFGDFAIGESGYPLTVTVVGTGTVAKSPDLTAYTAGSVVTLTATPATGWTFTGWSGDASGATNPLNVTMDAAKNITATFTINTYALTLQSGGNGTVAKSPDQGSYNYSTVITLTATPATGYHFVGWSGDTTAATNPMSFRIVRDLSVTGSFAINTYALTVVASPAAGGTAAKDPDQASYDHGTLVTLTATPATHYHFVSWTGGVTGTANPVEVTMTAATAATANFALDTYTVAAVVGTPSGSVARNPSLSLYDYGTAMTVTATPTIGYHFVDWTGDTTATTNPLPLVVTYNRDLTANFAINGYALSVTSAGNGSVAYDPVQASYDHGTLVTITATPDPGYAFLDWTGDLTGSTNPVTITMDAVKNITANFIATHSLTLVAAGSGTVAKSPDQALYNHGTLVTLTGTPATGYHFVDWSGDTTATTNPMSFRLVRDLSVTGTFQINTYTLTVTPVGSGSVSRNPDQPTYDHGTVVTLTATPVEHFHFVGWTGDTTTTTNPLTLVMAKNRTLTATFTIDTYTLAAAVGSGSGTVVRNPSLATYNYGAVVTVTATPGTGYSFTGWTGDTTDTANPITVVVTRDRSLGANFVLNTFALTVSTTGNGTVTKNPDQASYGYGTSVTLIAAPAAGYAFVNWTGDTTATTDPLTLIVTRDRSLTANFVPSTAVSGEWQTRATGNWSATTTWQRFNGTQWLNAGSFPRDTSGIVTILTGHTVTVTAAVSVDQVVVSSGGQITVSSAQTLTVANGAGTDLDVRGTLSNAGTVSLSASGAIAVTGTATNSGTLTINTGANVAVNSGGVLANSSVVTPTGTLAINAGGKYQHAGDAINIPAATWDIASTCEVTGIVSSVGTQANWLQSYGNFVWNCPSQGSSTTNISMGGNLTGVRGDLTVVNTGAGRLNFSNTAASTTNIGGNVNLQGGILNVTNTGGAPQAVNVGGNWNQTGGTFMSSNASTAATVRFLGSGKTFTLSGGTFDATNVNVTVAAGSLTLNNGLAVPTGRTFTDSTGATLNCGTNAITGAGAFVLSTGATLGIGSPAGITASGATGNIQTTTRTFNVAGNYTYNGASAQVTGSGLPATVNNLTINNAAGVTLTASTTANGTLTFAKGKVATNAFTLGLASANPTGASQATGWAVGNYKRNLAVGSSTRTFDVGDASLYAPVTVAMSGLGTATDVTATTTTLDHPSLAGSGLDPAKSVNRYWTLTPAGSPSFTSFDATFGFDSTDVDAAADPNNFVVARYASPSWFATGAGARSATSTQGTGITAFGDFAVAEPQSGSFALFLNTVGSGTVAKNPDLAVYPANSVVSLTATPAVGQHFVGWSGDASGAANPLDVTMDATKNITATFAIDTYALTLQAVGNGTVAKVPDQATYNFGTVVTVTATPATGYHLVGWSGDATGTTNPLSVTMSANKAITATFAINTYTLAAATTGSGTVIKSPDQATYDHGTPVTLTATPADHYHFVNWTGDTTATTAALPLVMTRNRSVTANFAIDTYTVTATSSGNGTVARNPSLSTYNYGAAVTVTATPNANFQFANWTGDTTATTNPLSLIVTANRTLTANFTIATYALNVTVTGGGSVAKSPDQALYNAGQIVTLTATPATGYTFWNWTGDVTGTANPTTVTMSAARSVTANFAVAALPLAQTFSVAPSGPLSSYQVDGTGDSLKFDAFTLVTTSPASSASISGGRLLMVRANATGAALSFTRYTDIANPAPGAMIYSFNLEKTAGTGTTSPAAVMRVGSGFSSTTTAGDEANDSNTFAKFGITETATSGQYQLLNIASGATATATGNALITWVLNNSGSPLGYTAPNGSAATVGNDSTVVYVNNTMALRIAAVGPTVAMTDLKYSHFGTTTAGTFAFDNFNIRAAVAYALNVSTVGSGTVTKNPNLTGYSPGSLVTLTATPATGWSFSGWSGDASGSVSPTTVTMDSNKNVTATFTAIPYTVDVTSLGNGSVAKSPVLPTYVYGQIVTVTATPDAGFGFVGWTGDLSGSTTPTTITVNGNKSATATFAPAFTLALTTSGSGSVAKSPNLPAYFSGASVTLTATPATGWHFVAWTGDLTGSVNPSTITMDANKAITATFAINTYALDATVVGSGTVTKTPDQATYDHGTSVSLQAVPATGWHFVGWAGALSGTTNPGSVTMDANKSVTATFAINTYTLAVATTGNGAVSKAPDQATYNYGTVVTLTATPDAGYSLVSWTGDLGGFANPASITMDGNKSITANFAIAYALTLVPTGNGTITKSPDLPYYSPGTVVTITAVPATGWHFVGWSFDAFGSTNPTTVTMNGPREVHALFVVDTHSLSVTWVGSGSVTKNPNNALYDYGTLVTVTANPNTGYHFTGWSGDASGTTNPLLVTVDADKSITATFAVDQYSITSTVLGSGTVAKSPDQALYDNNTFVQVTAVPTSGWHFVEWAGDASGSGNPLFMLMNGNKSLTATFAITGFVLDVTTIGSGTVSKTPDQPGYPSNESVTLTAAPSAGWHFVAWTGDATGSTNPTTVAMDSYKSVTATFAINTYTLAAVVAGGGSVTKSPDLATYNHGMAVLIDAVPAAGHHFVGWTGDLVATATPYSLTMDSDKTVTATFAINTYALDVSTFGSGTVTKDPDLALYDYGTVVTLTANPTLHYHFVGWSGSATGTVNPTQVVMDAAKSATATFAIDTYTLAMSITGSGTVYRTPDQPAYDYGTSVGLQAYPNTGYHFVGWSGDATGATNPTNVVMDANKSVTATFAINTYSLDVSVVGSGSVTKTPDQASYDHGTAVSLQADAAVGYHLLGWSGDAGGNANPLLLTIDANKAVTATFAINQYTLDTQVVGSGSVQKTPSQLTYDHGTTVSIAAVPGIGYHFVSWSGDVTGSTTPTNVTMDGAKSVTARFAINTYTLDVTVIGNGTVTKTPDQALYEHGTTVSLEAVPAAGYHLVNWSGDLFGWTNPSSLTMDGPKSVTATFAINTYALGVQVVGTGSVTKTPDLATYDHGSSVTLEATPVTGNHFVGWTGDLTGSTNPASLTMDAAKSVTATFTINTYALDMTVVGTGTVTKTPDQASYDHGTPVTLEASAPVGWHFAGWSGDLVSTVSPIIVTMDANKSVTATFTANQYTLGVTVVGSGSVTKTPDRATYDHGTSVSLEAVPATGYHLVSWSGDATGSVSPTSVLMDDNKSVTATFAINTYALDVHVVGSGSVTKTPDQASYDHGTSVSLEAVPALGYHFVSWTGDASGSANPLALTMDAAKSVTATFAINTYALDVQVVGSGSVTKTPDRASYDHGTSVSLEAVPAVGYHFVGWAGDATGANSTTSVLMDGAKSVTATFAINTYALDVQVIGSGSVTKTPDQALYDHGTSVSLEAVPAVGHHFVSWSGDASGSANPFVVTMDGAKSVTATFAINTYALDIQVVGSGSVTKTPDQASYDHGTSVSLEAVPAIGYHFVSWTGDATGTVGTTSVLMDGAKSVTATFAINTYALAVQVVGSGSVTKTPDQALYDHGTSVSLEAVPALGHHFVSWTGDATGANSTTSVVMDGAKSVTATFAINTYALDVQVVGSGSVTKTPDQALYDHGTSVSLEAVPAIGRHFVSWTGDATGANSTTSVLMDGAKSVTATFAINTYALDVQVVGSGSVTKTPDQASYDHGTSVNLAAVPAIGYHFVSWTGDATGANSTTSVVMDGAKSVTAAFAINTYALSVQVVGSGSVTKTPDQALYDHGTSVSLEALPAIGQHFVVWSGDASGSANPFVVTMDAAKSVTATFAINTYVLNVQVVGSGSVTKTPDQASYDHGTSVNLEAVPAIGYHFVSWSGDATGANSTTSVVMDGAKSVTATFAINTYALAVQVAGSGSVTKTPDQPLYDHGTSVSLEAVPALGHHFVSWSGDATGTVSPTSVVMDGAKSVTATFAINTYALDVQVVGSGSVTKTPDQALYDHGTSVGLEAVPALGHHFVSWTGDATGTVGTTSVLMDGAKSVTATFAINTYALDVQVVGSGSVTKTPDQANYDHGTSVSLEAVPALGYHFVSWSGDATGSVSPTSVLMDGAKSVTATFGINTYALDVQVVGSGSVTKTPDQVLYDHGTSVSLEAVPAVGHHFVSWTGDATGSVSPTTVVMDGAKSVTATFAINTYALDVQVAGAGSVTKTPDQALYDHGTPVSLEAVPALGHHFVSWTGDASGSANPFVVTMDGAKSVTATFAINTYALAVQVVGSGSVTKTPDQVLYDHGTSVSLEAVPALGHHFVSWSGDATGANGTTSVVMDGAKSMTATFAINTYALDVQVVGPGSVTKTPDQALYDHGTSVSLEAVPALGQHFVVWSGDASGSANPFVVTMDAAKSVTATFAINTYVLNVQVVGSGSVTKTPDQASYDHGTSVNLEAVPAIGYHFVSWSGDATGANSTTSVVMDGAKSVTATFAINTYALAVQVAGSGSVTKTPDQPLYDHGTSVSLEAVPAVGHHFVSWTGDATGANSTTSVLMDGAKSVTATFAINTYALDVQVVGSGSVTKTPNQATYDHGTSVSLEAVPAVGHHFVSWTGDATGANNTTSVVMDGAKSVTATFAINTYALAVQVVGAGSVTKTPNQALYDHGTSVNLEAVPALGHHFVSWTGDATGANSTTSVVMDGAKSVTATFAINTYALAVQVAGSGSVTKTPDQALYDHGTSVSLEAVPALGQHFVAWSGDASGSANPFALTMDGAKSVTATFGINTYALDVQVVGSGSVTKTPDQASYDHGTSVSLEAVPALGHHFVSWTGDASGSANPFVVTMDGAKSVTATFAINTYALAVQVAGSGSVTKTPDQALYDHGTSVSLEAVPAIGHHFVSWSGDASGSANPFVVTMDGAKSVTAAFAINTYALDVQVVGSGSVTKTPDQALYDHGTPVSLEAVPALGHHFVSWTGDASGSANPFVVTMDGAKSVTATFAINTYALDVQVVGSGSVTKTPNQATYDHGTSVSLEAVPAVGHHFVSWTGDATGANSTTSVVMDGAKSVTATFAINTYALDVQVAGSGSVTKTPDQALYDHGTPVSLEAVPALGYHFLSWTGDLSGSANPAVVTMNGAKSVTASFSINSYALEIQVVGSGSVTKTPDQASYDHGASVSLEAVPAVGYHFVSWTGDATGAVSPASVLMNANKSVTATFAINTYALEIQVVGAGSVAKNPDQATYTHGSFVGLQATPETGYHFVGWAGDVTGSSIYASVTMDAAKSVTATFAINEYTLDVHVTGAGTATKTPDQATYTHGTSVSLEAAPGAGYHFAGWSGDATGTSNPITTTMDANKSVTATFSINQYALDVAVTGSGSVTKVPNLALYDHGTSVQLSANPAAGWHFVGWNGDATGSVTPVDVTVDANKSVTATFAINQYALDVQTVGSGTVAKSPDQPLYDHGTFVDLTAHPAAGWHLVSWSGDATGSASPISVMMDAAKSVTATFAINEYTLNVGVVGTGSVTKTPDQATYSHGSSVSLEAVPGTGYHFVSWTGDATGATNPVDVTMDANKSVTAVFAINQYTLDATVVGSGSVVKAPNQALYDHGTAVQLSANPAAGWHFVGWGGDASGSVSPVDVTMDANKSVTATFAINQYALGVTVVGSGAVVKTPDQALYDHGTFVDLTASPASGWHLVSWSGDASGSASTISVMMDAAKSVTATFAIDQYALGVSVTGSGSVVRSPDQASYDHGTVVQLSANPATGWHFIGWSGDVSGTVSPVDVTMDANKSVTATFAINQYALDVHTAGSGTVSKSPDLAQYDHGTVVHLSATPATGWHLVAWSGDASGTVSPVDVTMDAAKSVTATFAINEYALGVTVVGTGSVTKTPDQAAYAHGTTVSLEALPGTGQHFVAWGGDASGSVSPVDVTMDAPKSVTATFAPNTYPLDVVVVGSGSVTRVPDAASYDYGTTVSLGATPSAGWHFVGWSGDASGSTSPVNVLIDAAKSVTATFAINEYALNVVVVGNGSVTKTPDQTTYTHGNSVSLEATPASGSRFVGWSGDASGSVSPTSVTMDGAKSVTATFEVNEHALAVTVLGSGTVTKTPDQATYTHGSSVSLEAVPATGYHFVSWSGDASGSVSPTSVTMDADKSVTATFEINEYVLSVVTVGSGSVSKTPDQATYVHGTSVSLEAVAAFGYHFVGWSGDASGSANPTSVTMDAAKSVTATFAIDSHTLTVSVPGGHGSVSKSPNATSYEYGTVVTLTAAPALGYHFAGWDGDASGTTNPTTVLMDGDKLVTATFAINQFTLDITTIGSGSVSRNLDQAQYDWSTMVLITANPAAGWHFTGWSGDMGGSMNPINVLMDRSKNITATFAQDQYTLDVSVVGLGTVQASPMRATYLYGDVVNLTATHVIGSSFVGWSGAVSGSANPIPVTITGNTSVTATFETGQYALNVVIVGGGSVTKSPDQPTYPFSSLVTLEATPDVGWTFGGWSGDASGTDVGVDVSMDDAKTVTATFVDHQGPTVNVIAPNGGENLLVGSHTTLQWTAIDETGLVPAVDLYVSRDNGLTYGLIQANAPNTGSFDWEVSVPGTNVDFSPVFTALFKVVARDASNNVGQDVSDEPFSIFDTVVGVVIARFEAVPADEGVKVRWQVTSPGVFASITLERSERELGPWISVDAPRTQENGMTVAVDRAAAMGVTYWYRLVALTAGGTKATFGPVRGEAAVKAFGLGVVAPNPAAGAVRVEFMVAKAAPIRLEVLDVQGRVMSTLADGLYQAGRYQAVWDGANTHGAVPAGMYFLRYQAAGQKFTKRVIIQR